MERAALPRRLTWAQATVVELVAETSRTRSIVLDVPGWQRHRAGQHVDVRLTAEDGYQAQRSYSIGSAPEDEHLVLTVERIDDGEVSPYLVDELRPGDALELRGPVGGWFVWEEDLGGPLLLLAGGSGIVPLRAMLRHHVAVDSAVQARLVYSARTIDDVIYRVELEELAGDTDLDIRLTLTRDVPAGWSGLRGRVDRALLEEVAWPATEQPLAYICGPTGFVESTSRTLVGLGHDAARIRTERFGPTGDR